MATSLTLYGTNGVSSTLATAGLLVNITGASGNSLPTTKVGTATGYGNIPSQGTSTAWPALGSLGSPSGDGWLFDTDLTGQQIQAGTWTATIQSDVSIGSLTADLYVRAFKLASDLTTYTSIGNMTLAGQSLTTSLTSYTLTGSLPAMSFGVGDKLYISNWYDVLTNSTGSSTANIKLSNSNNATLGRANNMQIVTPGYVSIVTATVLVTNVGHNLLRDGLSGANNPKISYVALGTSSTAPSVNDTRLGAEVYRKKVASYTPGNTGEVFINGYFAPGDAVGVSIAEIGFFGGSSATSSPNSGVLLARGLYTHASKTGVESIQAQLDFSL